MENVDTFAPTATAAVPRLLRRPEAGPAPALSSPPPTVALRATVPAQRPPAAMAPGAARPPTRPPSPGDTRSPTAGESPAASADAPGTTPARPATCSPECRLRP